VGKVAEDASEPLRPRVLLGGAENGAGRREDIEAVIDTGFDGGWVVLGQVNGSVSESEPIPIPTGNEMEDAFESLALNINSLFHVASATTFPAISFTPISVYRTC